MNKTTQSINEELNNDNYFSPVMNYMFCGSSQLKQFYECEAQAMAQINGEIESETTENMLQGSYVHAWMEGEEALEEFKQKHPEIIATTGKNKGMLKEKFQHCETIIETLSNDKNINNIITQSEKEQAFVGEIFGVPFKIKVDLLNRDKGYFADLKCMASINKKEWSEEQRRYVNFVQAWNYHWQMAIYCEVLYQNFGEYFTPNIIAVSKEKVPDKALIVFETEEEGSLENFVNATINQLRPQILRVKDLKDGLAEPIGCGKCDYCKSKKQITGPIYWLEF